MSKLILVPQEIGPVNSAGQVAGYGVVRFQREDATGKIREKLVYNPALWDALRAPRKSNRQKKLISKVRGAG